MAFQHVRFQPREGLSRCQTNSPVYTRFEAAIRVEVNEQIERGDAAPPYTADGHLQDVLRESPLHGLLEEFENSIRTVIDAETDEPEHGGKIDGVGGFAVYTGRWQGHPINVLLEWTLDPEDEHSILLLPGHLHLYMAPTHLQDLEQQMEVSHVQ